jgi:hypothetical protein
MCKFLNEKAGVWLFAVALIFCACFAHSQGLRWDLGAPGSAGAATTQGTGLPYLVGVPNVTLDWCNYPADGVPCTNFATTYTSLALTTPCATNAQVFLQNGLACQATGDVLGNLGVFTAPNAACGGLTCYAYTLTANGVSSGPYLWVAGGTSTVTTPVPFSSTPLFPVTAQNQLFLITLTGNAVAQPLTFASVTAPVWIAFQITQDGTGGHSFTWPANTVGGCTEFFEYNGTNTIGLSGGCVTGSGPSISVGAVTASTIFDLNLSASSSVCTDVNKQLVSTCASVNGITVNGVAIAPGGSGNVNAGAATHSVAINEGNGNVLAGVSLGAGQTLIGQTGADPIAGGFASFNPPQRVVLASPVSMSAGVNTTILTKSVTFPAAAGTYRADMRYGVYITAGPNVCVAGVVDTTNSVTYAFSGQNANGDGDIAIAGAEISTATYAAGATVSFVLQAVCNNGPGGLVGATVNAPIVGLSPGESTYLSITPVLSN